MTKGQATPSGSSFSRDHLVEGYGYHRKGEGSLDEGSGGHAWDITRECKQVLRSGDNIEVKP